MVQMSLLPGGITAAATAFIAEHTTPVSDVEGMCPVCHENYSSLDNIRVLKVNDVAGCKHIFCEACISKVLSSPWGTEKKCPCCRAVWMAVVAGQAEHGYNRYYPVEVSRSCCPDHMTFDTNMFVLKVR